MSESTCIEHERRDCRVCRENTRRVSVANVTRAPWPVKTGEFDLALSCAFLEHVPEDALPLEDVTKEGKMIHAWGMEKVVEYLRAIARAGGL